MRFALFASYNGSILESLLENGFDVALIITNNPDAFVLQKAKRLGIPHHIVNEKLYGKDYHDKILSLLESYAIGCILLAGYMKKIDAKVLRRFPKRIVNSHPSLLPKYGGKGMYGRRVHEAVIASKEAKSGVTVHFVEEEYDSGEIILQKELFIDPAWSVEQLETKVKKLEKEAVIEALATICR